MTARKKTPEPQKGNPSAPSNAHFIGKLLGTLNDNASRLIDTAVGGDFQRLLNLLAVISFAAGAAFALVLVGALQ